MTGADLICNTCSEAISEEGPFYRDDKGFMICEECFTVDEFDDEELLDELSFDSDDFDGVF